MKKNIKLLFQILIFFSFCSLFFAQTENHAKDDFICVKISKKRMPQIPDLASKDGIFKEYSFVVDDNYKNLAKNQSPEVLFFKYTVTDDTTLFQLASRCNITYDTIASINGIETSEEKLKGKTIILPTCPGLFINKNKGESSLEILLRESYFSKITTNNILYDIEGKQFFFIPNQKFSPTERAYFLDSSLRLPIDKDKFWISSDFGRRKNPFSGEWKNHNGIDLAANVGTPVYAVKDGGVAICVNMDPTFGNYIILSHDRGKMTSVYAHLSKIVVEKDQVVKKGDIIGYVGQTGAATGPHLHFEIKQGGVAVNPETKLKLK